MLKVGIMNALAAVFGSMALATSNPYRRQGTSCRRVRGRKEIMRSDKREYDDAGISQDMRRYAHKYRNLGTLKKRFPFSTKKR